MTSEAENPALYYERHVFFCTNKRSENHPRGCCRAKGSKTLRNYMKTKAKELELNRIRINKSGCLDRCELGPTLVIYPEGVWYKCESKEDVDQVLVEHVQNGNRVHSLMLMPEDG